MNTEEALSTIKAINNEIDECENAVSRLATSNSVYLVHFNNEAFTVPHSIGREMVELTKRYYELRKLELVAKASDIMKQY